jgi:hypothetical protein
LVTAREMAALVNVALEMLVKASLELPAFATLDEIASRIRREVNPAIFEQVARRIALPDRVRLDALLDVVGPTAARTRAPKGPSCPLLGQPPLRARVMSGRQSQMTGAHTRLSVVDDASGSLSWRQPGRCRVFVAGS